MIAVEYPKTQNNFFYPLNPINPNNSQYPQQFTSAASLPGPWPSAQVMSYVMWPLAFMMGVPQQDCLKVGLLIGTSPRHGKLALNGMR
jgi:hypothetical protein